MRKYKRQINKPKKKQLQRKTEFGSPTAHE